MTTAEATALASPEQSAILKALLSEFDITIGVDRSGSMNGEHARGQSRWAAAQELTMGITAASLEIDDDGIDVVTFGGNNIVTSMAKSVGDVENIFKELPSGGTPLNEALQACFKVAGKSPKKDFILILTDGAPSGSQEDIARLIAEYTKKLDSDDACTILFVQLGNDPAATKFLEFLDDGLVAKFGAKFDIVDVMKPEKLASYPSLAHALQAAQNG
jgi:Mg-chelatase subunit ChlD